MKIILQINGGIGKSIMATAVCAAIKKQYPDSKLIVITGYPEVFAGNRKVDTTLAPNETSYFYRNHIENQKDTKLFLHDPYMETNFIQRQGHLIKVWCEMFGIKYNGELPELYINHKERTSYKTMFQSPKPIMVIQTNGGLPNQTDKYSWPRDLPMATAQKVVNAFASEYNIVQIRRQDQIALQNVFPVQSNFRALAVLIELSEKRLFIDSFAQHTAAALGKPSVVCWIANIPEQFGYTIHTNIIANSPTLEPELKYAITAKYNTNGPEAEFPYNNEDEIFDADKIIAALRGDMKSTSEDSKKKVKTETLEKV